MKSVLVIDIPNTCCECRLHRFADYDDWDRTETICTFVGKMHDNGIDSKPSWCPLKPLPKKWSGVKVGSSLQVIKTEMFEAGYNECLKDIAGEDNE